MESLTELFNVKFLIICIFFLAFYYYGKSTYNHWKNLGVAYMKPKYPLFGNSFENAFSIISTVENQRQKYDFFKGNRYGGIFHFRKPVLFLKDPELIESVLIKDFPHFYNRTTYVDKKLDPLSNHLVHMENEQWKNLRAKLTPIFSSVKLKGMHEQLLDCTDELIRYMDQFLNRSPFETREMMGKFTTDVIASCAFGLSANAIKDPDSEFRRIGKQVFKISFLTKLRLVLRSRFPWLLRLLNWRARPTKVLQFFTNTVNETLEYREKNNIKRDDFLYLMNELRKKDQQLRNGNASHPDNKCKYNLYS
ncbi:cytochrome P450 6a2-like [Cimex lectularius]|uniref:Cytochrome P450 n=1 Tax=Cimex lectularius TaxID=79782 RepID=A0A8I6TEW3_CIMLE|nr:cytochrome P450 6a2-like [Cimex lectularius]